MPRIKPPWASGQPGCVSGGFDDVTAPGFTEAQPMLIFFWPCFTLLGLSTCSIQSSSRESSRQHTPRLESQWSRDSCGYHWVHGSYLSTQALFISQNWPRTDFRLLFLFGFHFVSPPEAMNTAHKSCPTLTPEILAATGRKRSKHRCEVYVLKFDSPDNMNFASFDSVNFCTSR